MSRESRIACRSVLCILCASCGVWIAALPARAGDWPQWRYDAGRTAASPEALPAELHLQWVRSLPTPRPAFPKYPRLSFDSSYEPVVMEKRMFVPSMVTDSVTALETDTGAELWRFYTDGPVRLAPVAFGGKVAFVSDDGHLYCVDAADGRLAWTCRYLPPERKVRKVLGNDRLISLWPARGGPVLEGGKIYFAAGVWPFEGVWVSAVDAETGRLIWSNDEIGSIADGLLDHSTRRDAGLSPQGYLALVGDKLIVPSGRAMPGTLDRNTGKLEPYSSGWGGRDNLAKGCWYASGAGKYLFQSGEPYDLATGARLMIDPANEKELGEFREPVLTGDVAYFSEPVNKMQGYRPAGVGYERIVAWDLTKHSEFKEWQDEQNRKWKTVTFHELWSLPGQLKVHIKAGPRLYAGGPGVVAAIDIPGQGGSPSVSWQAQIEGTPSRMLAADGRLFVVTREGSLYCFGAEKVEPKVHAVPSQKLAAPDDLWAQVAENVLKTTGAQEGYCLALGVGSGRLVAELVQQSKLHVIAVDPDGDKVRTLRRSFDDAGLYGTRVVVHQGDPVSYPFPPYLASLIVSEDLAAAGLASGTTFAKQVFRSLRPYGGAACLLVPVDQQEFFAGSVEAAGVSGARVSRVGMFALLERVGALPGAADWTHENGDAGSSLVSRDGRVKAPFGVLWYGGAIDMLFPEWDFTHSGPPTPLVVGGRMVFQVYPKLHAMDVYTGRHLWTTTMPGTELSPQRRNLNYAAAEESVYLVSVKTCFRIDAATGSTLSRIPSPPDTPGWREVRVWNEFLVGAAGDTLMCADRITGEPQWKYEAADGLAAFAVGRGRVFCIDASLSDRRGEAVASEGRLGAFDIGNGATLWQTTVKLAAETKQPLRLVYSEANGILITAYGSLSAYHGENGTLLWGDQTLPGGEQPMLHRDRLITQHGEMYDPQTGSRLPGVLWGGPTNRVTRGCNRAIAGEYLVAVRDAHASYFDLADCRQAYFRGVRAGCTNALIPANGLLNAPDFSHGCSCNYAVFASLALVPMTEIER